MGGRGGSSGRGYGGSPDGVIVGGAKTHIETKHVNGRGGSYFKNEVLEATTDGNGNVTFSYAKGGEWEKLHKTNKTSNVSYDLQAGAVDGKTFGLDLSKAKSISGQTYSVKDEAKKNGFKWNTQRKRWEKP